MPVGIIINAFAILLGGIVGGFAGHKIPSEIKIQLNLIFGLSAMMLGITSYRISKKYFSSHSIFDYRNNCRNLL